MTTGELEGGSVCTCGGFQKGQHLDVRASNCIPPDLAGDCGWMRSPMKTRSNNSTEHASRCTAFIEMWVLKIKHPA